MQAILKGGPVITRGQEENWFGAFTEREARQTATFADVWTYDGAGRTWRILWQATVNLVAWRSRAFSGLLLSGSGGNPVDARSSSALSTLLVRT